MPDVTLSAVAQEIRDGLHVPLTESSDGGELGGKWLGRVQQPGVLLKPVHAMTLELIADGKTLTGTGRDPYGAFTIDGTVEDDVVRFRKVYDPSNVIRYAGRKQDGEIIGAWRFERVSDFGGVFRLVKAERVAEAARGELERLASSRLEGRWRMVLPMLVLAVALYASLVGLIPELLAPLVLAGYVGVMFWRKRQLGSLVERWEKSANETSLVPEPPKKQRH
jgi:hypothetical protein